MEATMEATLITNKTEKEEKEETTFEIFTKDFKNSHAVDINTGAIFQVVGAADNGGLLFYANEENDIGFNYAEDGDTFSVGTEAQHVTFCWDIDEKWNGSAVVNEKAQAHFDGLNSFSDVKAWVTGQGIKFENLKFN